MIESQRRAGWARNLARPLPIALLTLAACAALVQPLREAPLSDEWVYLLPIRQLFDGRAVRIVEHSITTAIGHVAWGASLSALFGRGLGALRVSTLLLALLALALLQRLAGRGGRAGPALLSPGFVLAANPIFLLLSVLFMTDIPCLAWSLAAVACFERAYRTDRAAWWLAGAAAASLAFLFRQVGACVPLAVIAFLALRRQLTARRAALVLALPAATVGAVSWWFLARQGGNWIYRHELLSIAPSDLLKPALVWVIYYPVAVFGLFAGLFTLPWIAGLWWSRRLERPAPRAVALLLAAYLPLLLIKGPFPYFSDLVSAHGLGAPAISHPQFKAAGVLGSVWFFRAITVLSLASLAAWLGRLRALRAAWSRPEVAMLGLSSILQFAAGVAASSRWGFYERYGFPIIPFALLWAWRASRPAAFSAGARRAASALGAATLLWAVAGTRDYLDSNQASWEAAKAGAADGIPAERILNGLDWCALSFYESETKREGASQPDGGIGRWDWVAGHDFQAATSFSARPEPGFRVLLRKPYRTPLSLKTQFVYLHELEPRGALWRAAVPTR